MRYRSKHRQQAKLTRTAELVLESHRLRDDAEVLRDAFAHPHRHMELLQGLLAVVDLRLHPANSDALDASERAESEALRETLRGLLDR